MNTIGITGGTGFTGTHIAQLLLSMGYRVIIFSRNAKPSSGQLSYAHWDADAGNCDTTALSELTGMVHLAGAGIADKRWTTARKQKIRDSRVMGTAFLVSQLKAHAPDCKTLICASAIGYYGPDNGNNPFTETSPPGNDFLSDTCVQWEAASVPAAAIMRRVVLRLGIVLGKGHGAFAELARPLSLGVMPILGSGDQMTSWISVHDLARLFVFALEHPSINGIYNAVAPAPVTHKTLMQAISTIKGGLHIPVPVPALLLKMILGEMSIEVLKSCTVSADKIVQAGFAFDHPDINNAVTAILKPSLS